MPIAGLPGTVLIAFRTLLSVLWSFGTRCPGPPIEDVVTEGEPSKSLLRSTRLLLAVVGLTGLASFIYEIAWIRMLSLLLGSSTHAFELMLATFITGYFGGLWIKRRIDDLKSQSILASFSGRWGLVAVGTVFFITNALT